MKIAINATLIDHDVKSGLQVYLENLLKGLAAIDENNEYSLLFTSLRRKKSQMPGPGNKNFSKHVLPCPDSRFPYKDFILNKVYLPCFLRSSSCEIYHAPAGYSLPRINKIKKILTIHDLRSLTILDKSFPQDIKSLKKAAKIADICIAVSECTKKDIIEYLGISQNKIKVIYLGVDDVFKPIDKEKLNLVRQKYNINKKYFFSLGLVPRKNIERLIKAFGIFKYKNDFLLVIGGSNNDVNWTNKCRELVNKLKIQHRVIFIGYVPLEDLPFLYNASECFIFPSLYEGFGIPILEAMRCGVPVITSNVSSLPEIGQDAALYVDPYSEEDIARQMRRLIENKELNDALVKKGFDRANKFSWERMAQETLKIYEEVKKWV
jgi:glycosyltransferase involved in cell wall biosynthesis